MLGTGTLSSGVATLNLTTLPAGSDSIIASYTTDGTFASATSAPVVITVSGSGPTVVLSPTSLTFPATAVGVASTPLTLTLTNGGSAALSITGIAISGDFSDASACGTTLNPGVSCTISVTFKPTVAGTRSGTLTLTDTAAGGTQTVQLTGSSGAQSLVLASPTLIIASPGGSATSGFTATPATGFTGTFNFTCAVTYQGTGTATDLPTCSLNPTSSSVISSASVTGGLTINTTAATARLERPFGLRDVGEIALAGLCCMGLLARRRHRFNAVLGMLCLGMLVFAAGCGGSSTTATTTTTTPAPTGNPGSTVGSYLVTVTLTAGATTSTASTTVTLQ